MKIKNFLLTVLVVLLAAPALLAQTATTRTYLTSALTSVNGTVTFPVGSTTGMTASTSSAQTFLAICDSPTVCELMDLKTIVSATSVTVVRGRTGSITGHVVNSLVWYGTAGNWGVSSGNTSGVFMTATPRGNCTRASNVFLPVINTSTGEASDCLPATTGTGDQWVSYSLYPRGASMPHKKLAVTQNTYTTTAVNMVIGVNTAVASTITLMACTGCEGAWYWIIDEAQTAPAGVPVVITVAGSSGQLVNGGASAALVNSAVVGQAAFIENDGANWIIGRR